MFGAAFQYGWLKAMAPLVHNAAQNRFWILIMQTSCSAAAAGPRGPRSGLRPGFFVPNQTMACGFL
jgi:hypothetical protein